ncbi:aromatic acid exporter family protein [Streptomyces sp. NPDC059917]|uniref:aromatic acid exporter family protein n=1 Tax=Streptomyces sp. NPDC059917 TaxID=3347002 RepID=UPI003648D136
MPEMITELLTRVARRRRDPVAVQALRSTAAAVVSYCVALRLSDEPSPLTAPLTALLVVQVTLYSTLTTSVRRVNAVVVGVLIAIGFSALVGLTWWSLGLLILASLVVGHLVRVDEFIPEVAISAMLVLGVGQVTDTAWDRVLETVIGAVIGLLVNLLLAPPLWVGPAGVAITDLASRMSRLLDHLGAEPLGPGRVARAAARLHEARRLDNDIAQVDAALRRAEDSLRFNPRVKEGLLFRLVLRTGLDTLEICAVVLRVACRTLTDLARARPDGPLFDAATTAALQQVLRHTAIAVESFAQLITAQVSANAEQAEARLTGELAVAREHRDRLAELLPVSTRAHPEHWQLYGALLTEIDRVLDELDVETRSQRLMEGLDQHARNRPTGSVRARLSSRLRAPRTRTFSRGPRSPHGGSPRTGAEPNG